MLWVPLVAAVCLPSLGTAQDRQPPAATDAPQESRLFPIRVVDEAGDAVEAAKIFANAVARTGDGWQITNTDYYTDERGSSEIEIDPALDSLKLWLSAEGYVMLFAGWTRDAASSIPDEITFTLQRGTVLGGRVVDADGEAVAGAKVEVRSRSGGIKFDPNSNSKFNPGLASGDSAAVSDEEGRWSISNAPPGDDLDVELAITHPDFIRVRTPQKPAHFGFSLQSLRDRSATITLQRGTVLEGRIVDPDGVPVADARLVWGDASYRQAGNQATRTNEQGRFALPPRSPGEIRLIVMAKGLMPHMQTVKVHEDLEPLEIQLRPGRKLHLRFVDPTGQPVPNVSVRVDRWRDVDSLSDAFHSNVPESHIPRKATEDGEYVWDGAPDDAVTYQISHARQTISRELTADDSVQTITLRPALELTGSVVNAATGEPITGYSVTPLTYWFSSESARGIAQQSEGILRQTADFKLTPSGWEDVQQIAFDFEKPGFKVYRTERFAVDDGAQTAIVRLEPTELQQGRVVDQEGRPVPAARVFVVTLEKSLLIGRFSDYFASRHDAGTVADDGTFTHSTQVAPFAAVAVSDEGYAERYCEPGQPVGDLVLQPWARVEGTLHQEGRVVPDAAVTVRPIRRLGGGNPHVQDRFATKTDVEGRFVLEKVPPVPSTVSSSLSSWDDYPITSSPIVPLDLQPGETHAVNLGGEGLQVVGQVKLLGEGADGIEFRYGIHRLVRTDGPRLEVPVHASRQIEHRAGMQREYRLKLLGGIESEDAVESHTVKLNPDGSFLINGVSPGRYRFLLQVYEPPTGCLVDPVGYGYLEFNTGDFEMVNDRLDLGTIEVELRPMPNVGDKLPNFAWVDFDEEKQSLTELSGKYVLFDFWATWCAPCLQAMPEVDRLQREVADNDRFAVISISVDTDIEAAKAVAKQRDFQWPQGFIGDVTGSAAGAALGISTVPLYVLVDGEGTILLRSGNLEAAATKLRELYVDGRQD